MSPVLRIFLITGFVCVLLAPVFPLKFKDCGSALSTITAISVSNCVKSPCTFKRGTTVNVTVTFVPNVEINKAKISVWGIWDSIEVPFEIPNSDGCKDSGLACPLHPDVPATYHVQLDIKKIYPQIALIAKWKMVDQDKSVFCFEIGVRLE